MDYFGYGLIVVGVIIMVACVLVYFSDIGDDDGPGR